MRKGVELIESHFLNEEFRVRLYLSCRPHRPTVSLRRKIREAYEIVGVID